MQEIDIDSISKYVDSPDPDIRQQVLLNALEGMNRFRKSGGKDTSYWEELQKDPALEQQLSKPRSELDHESILTVFRKLVEKHPDEVEKILGIVSEPEPMVDVTPAKKRKPKVNASTSSDNRATTDELPPGLVYLTEEDQIELVTRNTDTIHLTNASMLNLDFISQIITRNPDLKALQIPPSLMRTHMGPGVRGLLEANGIELKEGRIKDSAHYDEGVVNEEHKRRKDFFDEVLASDEQRDFLELLKTYDFEEIVFAELAFGSKPMSMSHVAKETGCSYRIIQRKLNSLLFCLGYQSDINSKAIRSKGMHLAQRVARIDRAHKDESTLRDFREEHKVKDQYPPDGLALVNWDIWSKTRKFLDDNPQALGQLTERERYIINMCLGLDGEAEPVKVIKDKYSISRERVRQIKNLVLDKWGLLDED